MESDLRAREAKRQDAKMVADLAKMYAGVGEAKGVPVSEDQERLARVKALYPNSPALWEISQPRTGEQPAPPPTRQGAAGMFDHSPELLAPVTAPGDPDIVIRDGKTTREIGRTKGSDLFPNSGSMTGANRYGVPPKAPDAG
jgi:hypothetical protein